MSSPAATPALPLLPVTPLDGENGYLRWKESVLLRLHTLGLAHVLSEEEDPERRPSPAGEKQQRARDDALCGGHILATLSDRLLPVYAHHATAGEVWRAVGLTYDLDMDTIVSVNKADEFRYDEGKPLLEQLALLQALVTVGKNLGCMELYISEAHGFPSEVVRKVRKHGPNLLMDEIWKIARKVAVGDRLREIDQEAKRKADDSRLLKRGRHGK